MKGLEFKSKFNEKEIEIMRDNIRKDFDRVQIILRKVSPYMLLVFRYTSSHKRKLLNLLISFLYLLHSSSFFIIE